MSQETGLVTLSHLSLVVTLTSDWTTNGCMGSPTTYTFPSSILLSLHSWFTNALFEWPRRHWNSPTSPSLNYPRSLSLPFSRVLRAYIGTPIHPTPYLCLLFYRQSHTLLDLDSCTYSAFCFDSASCPEHHCPSPPHSFRPTVFINGWSGTPNGQSAADGSGGITDMNGDIVPLSWICGSAVWILYSSSSLTLPSLLARILPLCSSLGFFLPCFPRIILYRSGRFLPVPIPFQLQRPIFLPSYATWPSLPPFPVASPPFTRRNHGSSAFFRRLLIHLPSQLNAPAPLSFLFLHFQGVGTGWRERPSLSPVLTTLIAVASSCISCLSWRHTQSDIAVVEYCHFVVVDSQDFDSSSTMITVISCPLFISILAACTFSFSSESSFFRLPCCESTS